jgi:hypothetical protein
MTANDRAILTGLFAEARTFTDTDRPAWVAMQLPAIFPRLSRPTQGAVLELLAELCMESVDD